MKFVFSCLMSIFLASGLHAQQVIYDENVEVRQIPAFSGIELSGAVNLYLSQGNTTGVAVSAGDPKYNSKIKTEVRNGVLRITVDGGMWNGFSLSDRKLKAYVSVADLNSLNVSGASLVRISGIVKAKQLQIQLTGASEIRGNIDADQLNMEVSGASVVKLAGIARQGNIDAAGASKINSYELQFNTLKASTSGASNMRVTVNKELNADASGGSSILYKGDAMSGRINASAGATIRKS
ncbi:head GIN domain-containing protein [Aridibaculum aurantiacum]|uniref:head GIN domain-containing protein n=1 Tax=Aridibaculum aurantiacum TaxID=2810307 RepID=UPI001A978549|nr:head GIN domain-containing protein [Aridibaculum aurantiacum]